MEKKCHQCSKPSTLHITELREGGVQELHLCESCAHQYLTEKPSLDESEGLESVANQLAEIATEQDLDALNDLVCPQCGISFHEFRSKGRLGCPHDYIAFEAELTPLLENIHGEIRHTGKFPKRAPQASQHQYRLIRLRNDLRESVENEEYEESARLRDEIQQLEAELTSNETAGDSSEEHESPN